MELQKRDLEILKFCLEQKFATLLQIGKMFYPESKDIFHRPAKRVCVLVNEGLLRAEHLRVCEKKLYVTTREGVRLLKEKQMDNGLRAIKSIDARTLEHDEMVTDVRIILDCLLGWSEWTSERVLKQEAGKKKVPDGVITYRDDHFVIEVERTLKKKSYYEKVFLEACRGDYRDSVVLYIMENEANLKWLMNEAKPWPDIYFATIEDLNEITEKIPFRNIAHGDCGLVRLYRGGVRFSKWVDRDAAFYSGVPEDLQARDRAGRSQD